MNYNILWCRCIPVEIITIYQYFILSVTSPAIISRHDQSAFNSWYTKLPHIAPYDISHFFSNLRHSLFVASPKYAFWNTWLFKNIILVWYASRVIFSVWHGKYPYRRGSWCIKFRTRSEFWISDWSGLWLVNWKSSKA